MPGARQPTDVVVANGRKHLSKSEEAERRSREVSVETAKRATPPKWLPETLRANFRRLGKRLIDAGIYTALDGDTLGRYLVAQHQWLIATQHAESALTANPVDLETAEDWGRIQDRYFKQARACASDLGLTVTARCRLVVPEGARRAQAAEDKNPFLQLISGGLERYG